MIGRLILRTLGDATLFLCESKMDSFISCYGCIINCGTSYIMSSVCYVRKILHKMLQDISFKISHCTKNISGKIDRVLREKKFDNFILKLRIFFLHQFLLLFST